MEVEGEGGVVLSTGKVGVAECVSDVRCVGTAALSSESRALSSTGHVTHSSISAASTDSVFHLSTSSQRHKIVCLLNGH